MIFGNQIHFKKKNKAEIVKAPSVFKITTRISIADGLILLFYSIKHYERIFYKVMLIKFYCLPRKKERFSVEETHSFFSRKKLNNNIVCSFAFLFFF